METSLTLMCDTRGNLEPQVNILNDGTIIAGRARTHREENICNFFMMDDLTYEATIDGSGYPTGVPIFTD